MPSRERILTEKTRLTENKFCFAPTYEELNPATDCRLCRLSYSDRRGGGGGGGGGLREGACTHTEFIVSIKYLIINPNNMHARYVIRVATCYVSHYASATRTATSEVKTRYVLSVATSEVNTLHLECLYRYPGSSLLMHNVCERERRTLPTSLLTGVGTREGGEMEGGEEALLKAKAVNQVDSQHLASTPRDGGVVEI
jgi:hypothetical protein